MKPSTKTALTLAALLAALPVTAVHVQADTIILNDLTDTLTLTQIGTSTHVSLVPCDPALSFCGGEPLDFTIDAKTPAGNPLTEFNGGPVGFPLATLPLGLAEPGFPPAGSSCGPGCIFFPPTSDYVTALSVDPETVLVQFNSDSDSADLGPCGHFPIGCVAIENGTPQTMFTLGWADGTSATIQIQSDAVPEVPEPSGLLLFASGLVGLAAVKRKLVS
jgi:hypothetical protein